MKNNHIVLDAILSKNIFDFLFIDRDFTILDSSPNVDRYIDNQPKAGDDIFAFLPELIGLEDEISNIFLDNTSVCRLNVVSKNEFYINISIEYVDEDRLLILMEDITKETKLRKHTQQYSNEITMHHDTLKKIIDAQKPLLFVVDAKDEIEFANRSFLHYFDAEKNNKEPLNLYNSIKSENIKSYDELHNYIKDGEINLDIHNDIFIIHTASIEANNKLFTLSKITDIYNKKKDLEMNIEIDELTGIYKKRYFDYKMQETMNADENFLLVVVDIDDFKAVNDKYGHLVGDEVLKEFSSLLKSSIREDDLVARWGGEEFLMLIKHSIQKNAIKRIEALRKSIEEHIFKDVKHLTASFGLAWREECSCDSIDGLLHRADKALYRAKNSGKNMIIFKKMQKHTKKCLF